MTAELTQLQNEIQQIGSSYEGLEFVYEFLLAYKTPKATIARLRIGNNSKFYVSKQFYCEYTSNANLYSALDELKTYGLSKIRARFILLVNADNILSYDLQTMETLSSTRKELFRHFDFFFPLIGIGKTSLSLDQTVDIKAAERFAELYNKLLLDNENINRHHLNLLIVRFLFCFFADSLHIIPKGTFSRLLSSYTRDSGEDMPILLKDIFSAFSRKTSEEIPQYLSSLPILAIALFKDEIPLPQFNKRTRQLLLEISKLDWLAVNPDILGSLIQSVVSPENSSGLSNNFTSVANINKLIRPLFLDNLYEAFEIGKNDKNHLQNLLQRIYQIRVFDPSCGAGNFLIVSFKELKQLEAKVIQAIYDLTREKPASGLTLSQFYGIEENELACEIAKLGLFFTDCQLSGEGMVRAKLTEYFTDLAQRNIIQGNATRIKWEVFCPKNNLQETYILGNPSYKGARKQSAEQKLDISHVFNGHERTRDLDYAACWFYLAASYIENSKNAFAFVTTNSLTQGQQVELLWPKIFAKKVHISFAHTSFKWKNSGKKNTGVTVVIVGVKSDSIPDKRFIFTQTTKNEVFSINAYLTSVGDIIISERTKPISNLPNMPKGNMPYDGGHLLLTSAEKDVLLNAYPQAERFLKRVMGSVEFIKGIERWCIWIDDKDLGEALSISPVKSRITLVEKSRLESIDPAANRLAKRPHQFRETRVTTTRSLIIPSVSSERRLYIPIGFVDSNTIITNLAFAIYDCEPWVFGVVSSRIHLVWIRAVCGGLETRIRYSSVLGYNTFPFPDISEDQKRLITNCVYDVLAEREKETEKTMAQMYNPNLMSEGLLMAHHILDEAVDRCYREEPFVSDQERLEFMFNYYKELSK